MREEKQLPSVVNGVLQRTSVSQIKKFDDTLDTGCHRRWYFDKVLHIPEPPTKNQELGIEIHAQIEHYLKTGEDVLGPFAREAKRFLPEPGHPGLQVERSFADLDFKVAGVPLVGYMDMVNATPVWLDNEGITHTLEEDCVEIGDHKSTSSLAYCKNPTDLREDTQMVTYGVAGKIIKPSIDSVRLSHNYICTRKKGAKKITVEAPIKELQARFDGHITATVEKMKSAASLPVVTDLAPNLKACNSFNKPCPYLDKCQKDPLQALLLLTDLRSENKNAKTDSEAPGLQGERKVAFLDKLKPPAAVAVAAPAPPPAPAPEPSIGIGAPEKAPADPVLDRQGEEGQFHEGKDGQLYQWKEGMWRFAGAEARKKYEAMKLPKGEYDHSPKAEPEKPTPSAAAEQPEKRGRGRPPGAKNKNNLSPSVPTPAEDKAPPASTVEVGGANKAEAGATAKAPSPASVPADVAIATTSVGKTMVVGAGEGHYLHTYYKCVPSVPTLPAEPYILGICDDIVKACNQDPKDKTTDIRSSKNELLAFGAWKGTLERAIKARPPMPGAYRVLGGGELYEVAAEAMGQLSSLYVRGVL